MSSHPRDSDFGLDHQDRQIHPVYCEGKILMDLFFPANSQDGLHYRLAGSRIEFDLGETNISTETLEVSNVDCESW